MKRPDNLKVGSRLGVRRPDPFRCQPPEIPLHALVRSNHRRDECVDAHFCLRHWDWAPVCVGHHRIHLPDTLDRAFHPHSGRGGRRRHRPKGQPGLTAAPAFWAAAPGHLAEARPYQSSPRWIAVTAACARLSAPSLFIAEATCDLTVRSAMLSAVAICLFGTPSLTNRRTAPLAGAAQRGGARSAGRVGAGSREGSARANACYSSARACG